MLAECGRKGSLKSSLDGLKFLCSLDNLETHADLIAGLPSYALDMLAADIAELIKIGVDELQVESLKVLPGTRMRNDAASKGLKYSPLPPYEVLMTPSMSAYDLRTAMQISRMIDFYYNAKSWQNVVRSIICSNPGFIMEFTEHLRDIMVLDSPLSLERRGVILYEYCKSNYPDYLADVSIAWIEAGYSLKKEPAGDITKIKNIKTFIEDGNNLMPAEYGEALDSHRYYLLKTSERHILFGYNSKLHQPSPVFRASVMR